jgi:hypothetical protein
MWTDWTQTDPQYFYLRGALFGAVAATMFWTLIVPSLRKLLER